jgi:phosphate acetyltransferase
MTEEKAVETMKNPLYYGVMMVYKNMADGMVAGACNATANVIRPALQILKTAPGTKLVSAFFAMCLPTDEYGEEGNLIFADSGLNENPDADAVSEIALSSAESFRSLIGGEPKVAMLSYSTYGSAKSELVEKMQLATKLAKEKAPELAVDGELQLDAAIVPSVAALKAPESKVAGHANVLVFPDLNSGNIGYKLVQRFAHAEAYGPVLQGIRKPVNDLSRGCSWEDIVGVIAITCVQAQNTK